MWRACVAQVLFLLALWPLATHIKETTLQGSAVAYGACGQNGVLVGDLLGANNTTTWEIQIANCKKNFTYPEAPNTSFGTACFLACQNFSVAPSCWNHNDWTQFPDKSLCTCHSWAAQATLPLVVL